MDFQNLPAILTPDLGLLFWMLLAFLIIFFVLAKFGFPAITKMVEDRKAYIDDSLEKAREANEKIANIKQESEALLKEAREQQSQILKEAQATREKIVEKAQDKAREEGARIIADAKAEIESEKANAVSEIRKQVSKLSVEIASKILRQNLATDAKQMELIDRLLDEVSASSGENKENK
ncbi:MAG: F0F1 ATP synthase subunit B [Prevotella sp.]|nr:F0F1 ATP synthase subunit B [Prevotella sp.]